MCLLLLCLTLSSAFLSAEEESVTQNSSLRLPYPIDYQLEEIASGRGITPEQLRQARIALYRATDAADLVHDRGVPSGLLLRAWTTIDFANTPAACEGLYNRMQTSALRAKSEQAYVSASYRATGLLSRLAKFDGLRAIDLARQWPPPRVEGEKAQHIFDYFVDKMVYLHLQSLASANPPAALTIVERNPELRLLNRARAYLARWLMEQDQEEQASLLARECIDSFQASESDRDTVVDFLSALTALSLFSAELYLEAYSLLERKLEDPQWDGHSGYTMGMDGNLSAPVTKREGTLIAALYTVRDNQELMEAVLSDRPRLKAKLKEVDLHRWSDRIMYPYEKRPSSEEADEEKARTFAMQHELSNSRDLEHDTLSRRLRKEFGRPEDFDGLLRSALMLSDLEQRQVALEVADDVVKNADPAMYKARLMTRLLPRIRGLTDELNEERLQGALSLLEEVQREPSPEDGTREAAGWRRALEEYEQAVVAEWARYDFSAVEAYVEVRDRRMRFLLYYSVAVALSNMNPRWVVP